MRPYDCTCLEKQLFSIPSEDLQSNPVNVLFVHFFCLEDDRANVFREHGHSRGRIHEFETEAARPKWVHTDDRTGSLERDKSRGSRDLHLVVGTGRDRLQDGEGNLIGVQELELSLLCEQIVQANKISTAVFGGTRRARICGA